MENRFRPRFQPQCDHRLSDSVRDGGNSKNPGPTAMRFRYLNSPYRGRKVRPRGHPIPDLVQIVLQIGLELLDGPVSYTHLRAHETDSYLVCRLLLEKK